MNDTINASIREMHDGRQLRVTKNNILPKLGNYSDR